MSKPSNDEVNAMRAVRLLISQRKWHKAYRAVDELRFLRARKLDVAAPYVCTPATVTTIIERKLQLSLRKLGVAA